MALSSHIASSGLEGADRNSAANAITETQQVPAAAASDAAACSPEAAKRSALHAASQGPLQRSARLTMHAEVAQLQPSHAGATQHSFDVLADASQELEAPRQLPLIVQDSAEQFSQLPSGQAVQLPPSPGEAVAAGQNQSEVSGRGHGQVQLADVLPGIQPSAGLEHKAGASQPGSQEQATPALDAGHGHPASDATMGHCCSLPVPTSEHDKLPHDWAAIQALAAIDWSQVAPCHFLARSEVCMPLR